MKKVIFYSYPICSTCRKSSKWLDHNNINYQVIDITKQPPSTKFLELNLIYISIDTKKIFNKRGENFKSINFDIFDLIKKEIVKLLANNEQLIKRPLLIIKESKLIFGFNGSEYAANF